MKPKVYLDEPNITFSDWISFVNLIRDQEVSTRSLLVDRFEAEIAKFLNVSPDRVLATNSGTSALRLALMVNKVGLFMNVHMPALTFAATDNAIKSVVATSVIHDVDLDTWNVPRGSYDLALAFIPVDLYGNPCEAEGTNVTIIDACESLGSRSSIPSNRYLCYSFNGNKTMTTGAGGLLVSPSAEDSKRARKLADPTKGGYNYRMAGLNAALGLVQLRHLKEFIHRKKQIRAEYVYELGDIIRFQQPTPGTDPCFWMTAGTFPDEIDIPALQVNLQERGIPSRRVFRPLASRDQCPIAWSIYDHGLCLPSSTLDSVNTIRWVCGQVREVL